MENEFIRELLDTIKTNQLVTMLVVFMTDFFAGIMGSKMQGEEIQSKKWINGLLRKSQIFLMIFCIGLVTTLLHYPLLYECFFWLFLLGEIKSIFENAIKMKIPFAAEISNIIDDFTTHLLKKISAYAEKLK